MGVTACPFCGGRAAYKPGIKTGYVMCLKCEVMGPNLPEAEAVAAWNARAPSSSDERSGPSWLKLYERMTNCAAGLTNYVEDRPELRRIEKEMEGIEAEARALKNAAPQAESHGDKGKAQSEQRGQQTSDPAGSIPDTPAVAAPRPEVAQVRKATLVEALATLAARLSDQLSPAEKRELEEIGITLSMYESGVTPSAIGATQDYQALAEHAIRRIADHHDDTTEALLIVDVREAIERAVRESAPSSVARSEAGFDNSPHMYLTQRGLEQRGEVLVSMDEITRQISEARSASTHIHSEEK